MEKTKAQIAAETWWKSGKHGYGSQDTLGIVERVSDRSFITGYNAATLKWRKIKEQGDYIIAYIKASSFKEEAKRILKKFKLEFIMEIE